MPFYRGVDCLRWSILNREKEIGTSTMILNSGVDTGNIVLTNKINLENELPTNIEQPVKNFTIIKNSMLIYIQLNNY